MFVAWPVIVCLRSQKYAAASIGILYEWPCRHLFLSNLVVKMLCLLTKFDSYHVRRQWPHKFMYLVSMALMAISPGKCWNVPFMTLHYLRFGVFSRGFGFSRIWDPDCVGVLDQHLARLRLSWLWVEQLFVLEIPNLLKLPWIMTWVDICAWSFLESISE